MQTEMMPALARRKRFRPVVSQLDGQRRLKAPIPHAVDAGQKGEGLGSQQKRNTDIDTEQYRKAAFTEQQPPDMQAMLEGEKCRHSQKEAVA